MKKVLLLITLVCACFVARADFSGIEYFHYTFKMGEPIPDTWNMWSDNYTPASPSDIDFKKGDAWKLIEFSGGDCYLMSNSTNTENKQANVGLVTPKISVPQGHSLFSFNAVNYNTGTARKNYLTIFITTKGNQQDDIDDSNDYVDRFQIPWNNVSNPQLCVIPMDKYAGQEVYIALVNEGKGCGYLGVNDFSLSQYYISTIDTTTPFFTSASSAAISFTGKIQTPASCNGFTAEFTTDNNVTGKYEFTRPIGNDLTDFNITFTDRINLTLGEIVKYTVTITPNFEGATPVSFDGDIICAEGYPGICVEEEATGERCTWCPRGAAALAKFSAENPERYIGIAVHCGGYSTGVMETQSYAIPYQRYATDYGFTGFPYAMVNRKANGEINSPRTAEKIVADLIAASTPIKVEIDEVDFDEDTKRVNVKFSPETIVAMNTDKYAAAAVLLADGLHGVEPAADASETEWTRYSDWGQTNGYAGQTEAQIAGSFGQSWVPYFEPFIGSNSSSLMLNMVYNHVAMGIWPDFYGEGAPLPTVWEAQTPQSMNISFDMPMQTYQNSFGVQDWKNTSVVILILDKTTGEIATAAKMKADKFNVTSGVKSIAKNSNYKVYRQGDMLTVEAEEGAKVDAYTSDGFHVMSATMTDSTQSFNTDNFRGMVIVRVSKGNDSYYSKMLWNK